MDFGGVETPEQVDGPLKTTEDSCDQLEPRYGFRMRPVDPLTTEATTNFPGSHSGYLIGPLADASLLTRHDSLSIPVSAGGQPQSTNYLSTILKPANTSRRFNTPSFDPGTPNSCRSNSASPKPD